MIILINLGLWNLDIKNTKWPKVVFFKNRVERYSFFDPPWTSMGMNWGQRCLKRPETICHRTCPVIYFIFLRRNCIAKENTSVPQKMVGDRETCIIKKKKKSLPDSLKTQYYISIQVCKRNFTQLVPLPCSLFMFYVCILRDVVHANRIFALGLSCNYSCNCLQLGLRFLRRWGWYELCLLPKAIKCPGQVAALAALGEAKEEEAWGQRAEKKAWKK